MADPLFNNTPATGSSVLPQAIYYIDPNDPNSGFLGTFNYLSSDQYSENVLPCPSEENPTRIHTPNISFDNGLCDNPIYLTIPERDFSLTTATLIQKNKSYPSTVRLNDVQRNVKWVGRQYDFGYNYYSYLMSTSGSSCVTMPSIEDESCWSIITFKIYQGNVSQNENDIIVFGYLEGQTYMYPTQYPYVPVP